MDIFIVTSGMYSDYGVVAAFETESKAKLYCAIHENHLDSPEILKLETEDKQLTDAPIMIYWIVQIFDDGEIRSKKSSYTIKNRHSVVCNGRDMWRNKLLYEVCFTVTEEKDDDVINKIARDRLVQYRYQKIVDENKTE